MAKPIYFVGGSKGGVGKSIVTMALVDYLLEQDVDVLLIDSDTSNPDVGRAYKTTVDSLLVDLDKTDGWVELLDLCAGHKDKIIVINGAARDGPGFNENGPLLNEALPELKRRLVTLWVINRHQDSLVLLTKFMPVFPQSDVHVLRNEFFGAPGQFVLYNDSDLRKEVEGRGGKSLAFPALINRVSDVIYSKAMSIADARNALSFGSRAELSRWRGKVKKMFEEIIDERVG